MSKLQKPEWQLLVPFDYTDIAYIMVSQKFYHEKLPVRIETVSQDKEIAISKDSFADIKKVLQEKFQIVDYQNINCTPSLKEAISKKKDVILLYKTLESVHDSEETEIYIFPYTMKYYYMFRKYNPVITTNSPENNITMWIVFEDYRAYNIKHFKMLMKKIWLKEIEEPK